MEIRQTARSYNNGIYIGLSLFLILLSYTMTRVPRIASGAIIMYLIISMFCFESLSRNKNLSLVMHGKIAVTLFMILAILFGYVTRDGKIFLILLSMPEVSALFYVKNSLFKFLRREMTGLFFAVWILQVIFHSSRLRELDLILAIAIHIVIQYVLQSFIRCVEFQLRKNVEQELSLDDLLDVIIAKKDEANQAAKSKSEFLSNMSHEIRTPINAILGMNEMILRESKETQTQEYADNIQNAGKMLLSLINDILDISKIESGRMEIIPVEYQMGSLINDMVNLFEPKVKEKHLKFQLEIDSEIPSTLHGDEVRIRQIMANLVSNAVKYTDAGKVMLSVKQRREKEDKVTLIFEVKDTGRGIRKEDIARLFESFQRVDEKNNRNIQGTGLGLTITKHFVEMMNGNIQVESEYGNGSTFRVELEQDIVKDIPMGDFKEKYHGANEGREDLSNQFTAPDAKILVVDDNSMNLAVVEGLLKGTQIQVVTAVSGKACLQHLTEQEFDVVLLDHMMPGMDGVETLKQIRKENLAENTPIIALTANAISGAREMYFDYGFDDYLSKPIAGSKLQKSIRYWLPDEKVHQIDNTEVLENASGQEKETAVTKDKVEETVLSSVVLSESAISTDLQNQDDIEYPAALDMETAKLYSISGMEGIICNLRLYLDNVESTRTNLVNAYHENAYREYGISAHALKSTSKTIGALQLSELARTMEIAGGQEDGNYIKVHHEQMLQMYDDLVSQIRLFVEKNAEDNAIEIERIEKPAEEQANTLVKEREFFEKDQWISLLDKMYQAAEEFDSLVLDEQVEKLQSLYAADTELQQMRKEAVRANEDCEYLELSDILSRMKQSILQNAVSE